MKRTLSLLLTLSLLFPGVGQEKAGDPLSSFSDQSFRTFRSTSVGGRLQTEERGGEHFFSITEEPVKGDLELLEDGCFVYTPREGKQGRDSFGYQIIDEQGSISRDHLVTVLIDQQGTDLIYEDMRGHPAGYAAVLLGEKGLFVGEKVAGRYCFSPEKPVTRGEFLSICMCLSGKPILSAVASTGCMDDDAIPVWMKSYVSTAALQGVEVLQDGCFSADEAITVRTASELSEKTLGLSWPEELCSDENLDRATMAVILAKYLES